jgi:hypothetical protein
MKLSNRKRLLSVTAILILLHSSNLCAQEKTIPAVNLETYDKVLNLLFPLDELNAVGSAWGFVTVLRYLPSFEAESQIVIVGREGKVRAIEYKSLDGNIYYKLSEIFGRTGREDSTELAKMIRISKRELNIPKVLAEKWRNNLIDSVSLSLKTKKIEFAPKLIDIMDDGTHYELWDTSVSGDIHYSPSGNKVSNRPYRGKDAFEDWMKVIQREVSKRK